MDNILQINSVKRWLAIKFIELGVQQIRTIDQDLSTKNDTSTLLVSSVTKIDPVLSPTLLDSTYYYTSFANWQVIIPPLNDITANFKWEENRFDCDKRANLIASLVALLFRLNTCMTVYCQVFDLKGVSLYYHYANIVVDDNGIAYLLDLDNGGQYQKITGNNMVMGNVRYHFFSTRTI